jgi:hypothetical protein
VLFLFIKFTSIDLSLDGTVRVSIKFSNISTLDNNCEISRLSFTKKSNTRALLGK